MNKPINPITWASQVTNKLLLLLSVLLISSCAMVIGHGNAVDESDVSSTYETLPELKASGQEALVVIVHEYYKRCCGASVDVDLKGQTDSGVIKSGRLDPVEDFICWRIPMGGFQWIPFVDDQSFEPVSFNAEAGKTYFYKLASDLRRPPPYEVEVQSISERYAYHYIQAALNRVREYRTTGPSPEVIEQIKVNAPKRVADKLKCL